MDRITPVIYALVYRYCSKHPEIEEHPVAWASQSVFFFSPKTGWRRFKKGDWSYKEVGRAVRFFKSHHLSEAMAGDQMEWMQKEKEEDS